ncbi:1-aminocyclopropane-1-carboxylate oxidase [Fagus crenata]
MARSPEPRSENPIDFRAPPPSPIASGRRSTVTNDDILTEFLQHSLRVPDLTLPDKAFPRQKFIESPPVIDLQSLNSKESDSIPKILDSLAGIGCFQLVNHGIPGEIIRTALEAATGVFRIPSEKKVVVTRSLERPYGFEEGHGEEGESELSEEFVWCKDEGLKLEMEGIWPVGYSNFSKKMETLLLDIEKVAEKIVLTLWENSLRKSDYGNEMTQGQEVGSVCCLYKHSRNVPADRWYDVIRMMIRGTDYSHALCLHLCEGSSEFHVYSKKGWVSFSPDKDALIISVGDQIQASSGGHHKHVIGRPIYEDEKEDTISMAFLCSPPSTNTTSYSKTNKGKTISLGQQALLALILTLIYQFFVYICKKF